MDFHIWAGDTTNNLRLHVVMPGTLLSPPTGCSIYSGFFHRCSLDVDAMESNYVVLLPAASLQVNSTSRTSSLQL